MPVGLVQPSSADIALINSARASLRLLAEQAFSRTAGAPLVAGNRVTLLRDARENYPAWLEAIAGARDWIHFESYNINSDRTGWMFAEALAERARAGVRVRLLCDWMGSVSTMASRGFWRILTDAGVETRAFNPPRLDSPFTWLTRDHRKMIGVDGQVAFVTGLCVGDQWTGDPARGLDPWRLDAAQWGRARPGHLDRGVPLAQMDVRSRRHNHRLVGAGLGRPGREPAPGRAPRR